jgi:hypothetical protein
LTHGLAELPPALRKLKAAYAGRAFVNEQAKEYAQHGLCRRLSSMVHMVETVFELLPPDLDAIPERATVMDASACIQNFVMNAFGCLENLAWIWVLERNVRGKGGTQLGRFDIGLGKPHVRTLRKHDGFNDPYPPTQSRPGKRPAEPNRHRQGYFRGRAYGNSSASSVAIFRSVRSTNSTVNCIDPLRLSHSGKLPDCCHRHICGAPERR